jgi:hypothetical protein
LPYLNTKDFEIKQTETAPLDGFEWHTDTKDSEKKFPFCCEGHEKIYQFGIERLTAFPDCCADHKKLKKATWFNKTNYNYFPLKLVTTVSYTWHCIGKCIDNDNWYKEITDYIDYTKKSYGQFPKGYNSPLGVHEYLLLLEGNIEIEKEIPEFKKRNC